MAGSESSFTKKLPEAALSVLLPLLVTWLVEALMHPQVWVLFVIGIIPLVAALHMLNPLVRRGWMKIVVTCVIFIAYIWLALAASRMQAMKKLAAERTEVSQKLVMAMDIPPSGDAWDSAIEVMNNSSYSIGKRDVYCKVHHLKGLGLHTTDPPTRFELGDSQIQLARTPSQKLEGGGRGESYECLCPDISRPCFDTYLSCADVTVVMHYSLESQPDITDEKSYRFSYNKLRGRWDQHALDSTEVYCN